MQLNGKRSYGKIASLPPEVRNAVDNMILTCTVRLPEIQAYIEEQAGVDVSTSTISRYGKRLSETYRDLTIAQENFEALRKELEKYPEQDSAEILTRIASHKMMAALVSKSDKDWNEMRADKLLKEISGLTRAMAYKQRVDIQNKDVVSAALDEVQASVFSALADEKPELYRQVVQFLDKKRKEGPPKFSTSFNARFNFSTTAYGFSLISPLRTTQRGNGHSLRSPWPDAHTHRRHSSGGYSGP